MGLCTILWLSVAAAQPAPEAVAHAASVEIIRDEWGVPHIYGTTDADVAFGLAYANAEDDWPMMQGTLAAARGELGLVVRSKTALLNDFYARFVDVQREVARDYPQLPAETRALLEAYAEGINYYALHHPDEVDRRLLPMRGEDIAAGFVHKLPLMLGLTEVMGQVNRGEYGVRMPGSNAAAVARWRSDDDVTRLLVNSHQPWEGPVTWYEAHLRSEEGWNMSGGIFPGAPFILHGHSDHLGWAMTVNRPDLIDVYLLETDKKHKGQYRLDGQWRDLDTERVRLRLDIGPITIGIPQKIYRSVHGPVLEVDGQYYAFRYASMGQGVAAVEQWYQMNRATDLGQWRDAMFLNAIPMFNIVYADRDNIFYVYNARLPIREEGTDYTGLVPGGDSALIWDRFLTFDRLPQVLNPDSGFLQANNATPFSATLGPENPDPADFSTTTGIETHETNRARRMLYLAADMEPVSAEDFLAWKWDQTYDRSADIFTELIAPLGDYTPQGDAEQEALALLFAWDGTTPRDSAGAALANLAWRMMKKSDEQEATEDPVRAFQQAVAFLQVHFGGVSVPLGDLQRLHRGDTDLPVAGGHDVLNATHARVEGGRLVGYQGDSFIMMVAFGPDGVRSEGIHQYGASNREDSPHYADQAPLFVDHQLRPMIRDRDALLARPHTAYHPGEE